MQGQNPSLHGSSRAAATHEAQATAQTAVNVPAVARKRAAARASTGSIELGSRKRPARRNSFVTPRSTKFVSPLASHALNQVLPASRLRHQASASAREPAVPPKPLRSGQPLSASVTLDNLSAGAEVLEQHECAHIDLNEAATCQILDDAGQAVSNEQLRQQLISAGADPHSASPEWVNNHTALIKYQLAGIERRVPALQGRLLVVPVVLDHLKYRYDREVVQGRCSALKRLLEQDMPPSRMLVLRVCSLLPSCPVSGQSGAASTAAAATLPTLVLLTDGWYCIRAALDPPLAQQHALCRLRPGTKLRIIGAELMAAGNAPALEASKQATLKLHFNGTHRIRSDCQLGLQRSPGSFTPLHKVHPQGGLVPQMVLLVRRKHPNLMWQRSSDGRAITSSIRAHAAAVEAAQAGQEQGMQAAAAQVQADEEDFCRAHLAQMGADVNPGEAAYCRAILDGTGDCSGEELSHDAYQQLIRFQERRMAAMDCQRNLRAQRISKASTSVDDARPLTSMVVSAVVNREAEERSERDPEASCSAEAVLTVWGAHPTDTVEGGVYVVTCLQPSERYGVLVLQTTKHTRWRAVNAADLHFLEYDWQPRSFLDIPDASKLPGNSTFDYAGVVIGMSGPDDAGRQWVFLADESCTAPDDELMAVQLQQPQDLLQGHPGAYLGQTMMLLDLHVEAPDPSAGLGFR
ncbi:hypothetical protein WJX73_006370 [Symbiochloris irregularis]|uniref:BRCA2 OB1 domain-containing protein n=1 Tax=Symbiochloris irregularis TaxID=706552 RepID=A0AAW1PM16_9CHLO